MARFTETVVAGIRHAYENTDQPISSIAADFHVSARTVQRLATEHGWAKRSERVRGLPKAMQLLKHVEGMPATLPPRSAAPDPSPPLAEPVIGPAREGRTRWPAEGAEPPPSLADEIEARVREIMAEEKAELAAIRGNARPDNTASERSARTLATLTQVLQALQRIRAGLAPKPESLPDDDMPLDLDEFRVALARRIEAFVASRTDHGDADGDRAAPLVDQVR